MDKTNGELLELLSYYDDLTAKQAECIAQMRVSQLNAHLDS